MAARAKRVSVGRATENGALLDACRIGDAAAWSQIVFRYERLVYAIPLREGLSREEAADVAQETFAALMVGMDKIADPRRLGSWLMTVARRLSWRHRSNRIDTATPIDVDMLVQDDLTAESIRTLWVYEAVQDLGEPCRSLVLGLFFDPAEPSYEEIAVRIGRPLGSVGPLRSRCLERLRKSLDAEAAG